MCVPMSSPDSSGEFEDDFPRSRLDWRSKTAVNVSYTKQGPLIY